MLQIYFRVLLVMVNWVKGK